MRHIVVKETLSSAVYEQMRERKSTSEEVSALPFFLSDLVSPWSKVERLWLKFLAKTELTSHNPINGIVTESKRNPTDCKPNPPLIMGVMLALIQNGGTRYIH